MKKLATTLAVSALLLSGCKFGPLPKETTPTPPPASSAPTQPAGNTAAEAFGWGSPLEWSDDFNTPGAPNDEKWSTYDGEGHAGNGTRESDNITVQDGFLRITGESSGASGGMASEYDFTHGRIEARVRSNGEELNPVLIIWSSRNQRVADGEYDFMELGDPGQPCIEAFIHYPGETPKKQEHAEDCNVPGGMGEWQNVAVEWTAEHVKGFINGREWFSFSEADIAAMPEGHLTIQLDNTGEPGDATLDVDWVNFYAP